MQVLRSMPRLRHLWWLSTLLLCAAMQECTVADDLRLSPDGSGSYRARIVVPKGMAIAMPDIKKEAEQGGYRVLEEGATLTEQFIVVGREFRNITEISDATNSFGLEVNRTSRFKASYRFTRAMRTKPSANGFKCSFHATMPSAITHASAGNVSGNSLEWDCSQGGTLTVEGSGLAIALSGTQKLLILVIAGAGVAALVAMRRRRTTSTQHCPKCAVPVAPNTRFCHTCGTDLGEGGMTPQTRRAPGALPAALVLGAVVVAGAIVALGIGSPKGPEAGHDADTSMPPAPGGTQVPRVPVPPATASNNTPATQPSAAAPGPVPPPSGNADAALSGTYFPVKPLPAGFQDFGYLTLIAEGPKTHGAVWQPGGIGRGDRALDMRNVRLDGRQFWFESDSQERVRFEFAGEFVQQGSGVLLRGHLKRLSSGGVQEADVELYLRGPEGG